MAELLIEIPDPLSHKADKARHPQLLLGSYVRVDIDGETLSRATSIERNLIQNGNQVWVMDENDQLDIRPVEVAYRGVDHALITNGLQEGERLVISSLPSPVQGMALRLTGASAPENGKDNR